MTPVSQPTQPAETAGPPTVWNYSAEEKQLGHRMRALTGRTDKCDYCGAMVNDCNNWPGAGGGTVWEPCKSARATKPQEG